MSILKEIAYYQNRRDEAPNQALARQLAESENKDDVLEIVQNLSNPTPDIQSDCIKVLYEIGYVKPELVAPYVPDILKLIHSPHNRLVWGGMIALSTIAGITADVLFPHVEEIQAVMERGSVITRDAGVLALSRIAACDLEYNRKIFPFLMHHLQTCRPKDVPQHAEKTLIAVNAENKQEFIAILERRMESLKGNEIRRVKKVIQGLT